MNKHLKSFTSVCDEEYFPGLWAMINSIYKYNGTEIPLYLFDIGLNISQKKSLNEHPLTIYLLDKNVLPFQTINAWECKQQVLSVLSEFSRYVLLTDSDIIFTKQAKEYFNMAKKGYIVSYYDKIEKFDLSQIANFYNKKIDSQFPKFNSGFLCIDVKYHWDIVTLWANSLKLIKTLTEEEKKNYFAGYGDQGILNSLIFLLNKKNQLFLINGCYYNNNDDEIIIKKDNQMNEIKITIKSIEHDINLIHCIGPKWWLSDSKNYILNEKLIELCKSFQNAPIKMPI